MFLDSDDLYALTGYKHKSAQVRWLKDHGFRFDITCTGRPAVTAAQVEQRQVIGSDAGPKFDSILRIGAGDYGTTQKRR
jgi:hypothetical protein